MQVCLHSFSTRLVFYANIKNLYHILELLSKILGYMRYLLLVTNMWNIFIYFQSNIYSQEIKNKLTSWLKLKIIHDIYYIWLLRNELHIYAKYKNVYLFETIILLKNNPHVSHSGANPQLQNMVLHFLTTLQFTSKHLKQGVQHQIWVHEIMANVQPQNKAMHNPVSSVRNL